MYSELDATVLSLVIAVKTDAVSTVSEHQSQDSDRQREIALSGEIRSQASSPCTGAWGYRLDSRDEKQPREQADAEGLEKEGQGQEHTVSPIK